MHSAVKIAWPSPVFKCAKQIAQVFLEDRALMLLDNREIEREAEREDTVEDRDSGSEESVSKLVER